MIKRPLFYEGQVLAGADLNEAVEYARAQEARKLRYLHTSGIASGLGLDTKDKQNLNGEKFKEVTLRAGVAIDRTGRQVVLAEDTRLDENHFLESGVKVKESKAWYPVFLRGLDESAPQAPLSMGSCATAQNTRMAESASIAFGRPEDILDYDKHEAPGVTEGPGGSAELPGTLILVGFVQWHEKIPKFANAKARPESVGPRYAGVQADEVVARSGRLTLRSRPEDRVGKPAVVVDETNGGELRFGLQKKGGDVTAVLTVNAKGDVTAEGVLSSKVASGTLVESGVISDGLLIPLPKGVTEKQVTDGQVNLHIHVTPRYQGPDPSLTPAAGSYFVQLPVECRVDGRRVICRTLWLDALAPANNVVLPGFCDYTVLAFVAPATGGSS